MLFDLQGKKKNTGKYWQPSAAGSEKIDAVSIIRTFLGYLQQEGIILSLSYKNHDLGHTVLEEHHHNHLQFTSPRPLPAKPLEIRLFFKYKDKLLHFFDTRLISVAGLQLKTTIPVEIFRIQRRSHYRVDVPLGSSVSFSNAEQNFAVAVRNVSASGMLLCTKTCHHFQEGAVLSDISFDLLLLGCRNPFHLQIREGQIVRSTPENGRRCYGASLRLSQQEENTLWSYIRQRELEILKNGLGSNA
jgi:hypothetical protein